MPNQYDEFEELDPSGRPRRFTHRPPPNPETNAFDPDMSQQPGGGPERFYPQPSSTSLPEIAPTSPQGGESSARR
jgi:hypothetical protein